MSTFVDVVIPCKGQAKYLPDAVHSLIQQTYPHWQCVIACGDDESLTVARELATLDHRICILSEQTTLGLADARNMALRVGKASYCMALDADDKLAPDYLEKLMPLVGPTTIAACDLQEFGDRDRALVLLVSIDTFEKYIPHSNMIPYASIFPRAAWEMVGGYDPMMFCFEDWDFWNALANAGFTVKHIPECLFQYRIHSEAMTLRHQAYEAVFRAVMTLRYVDKLNVEARKVLKDISPELRLKLKTQRRVFQTSIRNIDIDPFLTEPSDNYGTAFFQQMEERRMPYRRLADCIDDVLGDQTAIDIGCGIGLQTARLKELGWDIIGADSAEIVIQGRHESGIEVIEIDLTRLDCNRIELVDCVICTETAEHVEECYADTVVDNVTARAMHAILWSAAVPGQEWPGHVNLQPPDYWLTKFEVRGWRVDESNTKLLRKKMAENDTQHVACRDNFFVLVPATPKRIEQRSEPLLSFVMRVHNEEKTLYTSITSLFQIAIPIEIILVLHRCTDQSKQIALACQKSMPPWHRMKIVEYEVEISRAGLETFVTPSSSAHSLVSYYTFAFGLASGPWKFKWDGDFIAPWQFIQWIEQHDWSDMAPTAITIGHQELDLGVIQNTEPYAFNCLNGFAKAGFWEVPVFDMKVQFAYPSVSFIHASSLQEIKHYWRKEPWFWSATTDEAKRLRALYESITNEIGKEPPGCARSHNHEALSYLDKCKALIPTPI